MCHLVAALEQPYAGVLLAGVIFASAVRSARASRVPPPTKAPCRFYSPSSGISRFCRYPHLLLT